MESIPLIEESDIEHLVTLSDELVLVNICNPSSGIYIIMSPIIQRLKDAFKTDLLFYRVHTTGSKKLIDQLRLSSNCNLLLYKKGELVEIMDGLIPFKILNKTIEQYAKKE